MSIKRIKTKLSKMNERSKINIFDFNHIDKTLNPEKLDQVKDLYKNYHKKDLDL